jgi:DNA-binding response OmpR family regulator
MNAKHLPPTGELSSAAPQPPLNSRQRILVVDDDPFTRRLNSEALTCSGYQVDVAEDGSAAWEALQLNHYDLLITDNILPQARGLELIKKIEARQLDLPVIMTTSTVPNEPFDRYHSIQPAMTLLKPYTFDELFEAVKTVLCASNQGRAEIAPPNWQGQPLAQHLQL